jgi:predicted permease
MSLWFDLKYAWRMLKKSWGYSVMCATVVALSLGLAAYTWALIYGQLIRLPAFQGSEHWYSVQIAANATATAWPSIDAYTYQEMLKYNRSADYLGAFADRSVVLSEGQASTKLRAMDISPRFLAATQVPPILGRKLEATDGQPGAAPVAVLSYYAWHSYFADDPAIIGKTARIDSAPVQIVGVLPKDFMLFEDSEVWMPLHLPNIARPGDSKRWVTPFLWVEDTRKLPAILDEMNVAVKSVNSEYPDLFNQGRHADVFAAPRAFTHSEEPVLLMMGLMAAAVLLLGAVNISVVFLVRLLERTRELALRTALGARRSQLLRQCLIETVGIVLVGLVAGWGFGYGALRFATSIIEPLLEIQAVGRYPVPPVLRPIDMLIAVAAASGIWLLSTLVPAWRVAKLDAARVLAGTGKGTNIRSSRSVGFVVGLQVIVASIVLVACGNTVLSIEKEVGKPTGMDSGHVMLSTYSTVFGKRYSVPAQRLRYWEDLTAAIESRMPGAEVAFTSAVPTRPPMMEASIEAQQGNEGKAALRLPFTMVSDGYFQLLGIKLRSGRLFDSTDDHDSLKVAIIDEKLAARYWPDQNVLGKRVQLNPKENGPWLTIVGIVSAVGNEPYSPESGAVYQPLRQMVPSYFQLLVKLSSAAPESRAVLKAAAYGVDRDLPLHNLQMLDAYLSSILVRFTALPPIFAGVALITAVLAASSLFGLISRSVVQRTQEVGIRRALGATRWQATSMFVRQGIVYLCVAFVSVGVGTSLMPLLSAAIPNILDSVVPVTVGVVLLIAAVILSGSYLPTRRAVALEPGDAVRYE